VDFKGAPEASRLTINQWVEQKTENKIKDLLPPGIIDPTTRLVLTNAIYFKGDWQTPFAKARTIDQDFSLSPEQKIKTPMMHREGSFKHFNGGTFQALEIPYKSGGLSMIVLLPNDVGELPALERSLTAYNMRQWLDQLRPASNVILSLPKFRMEARFSLKDKLVAMGMKQAFDGSLADFSGMVSRKTMQRDGSSLGGGPHSGNLYISAVIRKAFVDVDEEGTEAAAATAVVHKAMSGAFHRPAPPPIIFCVDHPFVFLIRDNRSGGILFMGRVTQPSTQQQISKNVQQPAEATPAPIAPPPAAANEPASAPNKVSLGQTENEVVAGLGQPGKVANTDAGAIYYYKDLRVIFVNGKVTDVHPIPIGADTYQGREAEFQATQQKLLQDAESIVLSQDRSTADAIRSYPFLS
jgi:hypothetical protein